MRSTEVRNAVVWGIIWGAALAAVLAGGCGSATTSNAPATAAAACSQLNAASAARSARCVGGALADWRAYQDSQNDCAAYARHVAEGKVEYRPQGLAACLAEYEGPCDQIISNCYWDVLHGLVPDGQRCQDTEVCGTFSACLEMTTLIPSCGAVCLRGAREGETCGLYCGGATPCNDIPFCMPPSVCANNVCVKAKAAGDSCGASDPIACGPFLSCTADPADPLSTGTCQAHVAGGTCGTDVDCIGTEFCLQGTCAVRRHLGESCADVQTSCEAWTACDVGGHCAAAGRPGQACAPYPGVPGYMTCSVGVCPDGLTCVPYAGAGASCTPLTCAPGNECDATAQTCVACSR
jgi:hypothetical protein